MAARMTCLLVPVRLRATSLVGTQLGQTCSANILKIADGADTEVTEGRISAQGAI